MTYLLGLFSGIVLFALFGASFYAGYRIGSQKVGAKPLPRPPDQEEKRKAEQLKKDFDAIMGFTVDQARGV